MWLAFAAAALPLALGLSVLVQLLAARLTGARVYAIELSPIVAPRWAFFPRGIALRLGPLPLEAEVRATFSTAHAPRLGIAVRAAAPLLTAVLFAAAAWLAGGEGGPLSPALAAGLAVANGVVALFKLRPHESWALIGNRRGAVLELLEAPGLTDAQLRERAAWELVTCAATLAERGEFSAAASMLGTPAVTQYRHPTSTHVLASVLLSLGELERAEALFEELVKRHDVELFVAAYARNNLGYILLLSGDARRLPRATILVREAYALGFGADTVAATWAALLIRHGHLEMGLELMTTTLAGLSLDSERAQGQCFRAEALARLGKVTEARAVFAEAESLVKLAPLCAQTRAVLEAAREGVRDPAEPLPMAELPDTVPEQVVAPPPRLHGAARPRQQPQARRARAQSKPRLSQRIAPIAITALFAGVVAAAIYIGSAAIGRGRGLDPSAGLAGLGMALLGYLLGVPLHELGHGAMALWVGHQPLELSVGTGPRVRRWWWGSTRVTVNALWSQAFHVARPTAGDWVRLRSWLETAAGPLANVALTVAFWRIGWTPAAVVNFALAGVNLLPLQLQLKNAFAPAQRLDGWRLVAISRWGEEDVRLNVAEGPSYSGRLVEQEGSTFRAEYEYRQALTIASERNTHLNLGRLRFEAGDFAEARQHYEAMLVDPRVSDFQRAYVASELAVVYVLQRSAELLPLAEQLSEEAVAMSPTDPNFTGAWAAVQFALGRLEVGLEAMPVFPEKTPDDAFGGALCCLHAEALAAAARPGAAQAAVLRGEALSAPRPALEHAWALTGRPPWWFLERAEDEHEG